MNVGKTLFAQVMAFLPWTSFHRIVSRYEGDRGARTLFCTDQFRSMAFAQLTYRESLRDIEACLGAHARKLYHIGLRQPVRRSTLAEANESRDWLGAVITNSQMLTQHVPGDLSTMQQLRDFAAAFSLLEDQLRAFADSLHTTTTFARHDSGTIALNAYATAKSLQRHEGGADLVPHIRDLQESLGRSHGRKPKTPVPAPQPVPAVIENGTK